MNRLLSESQGNNHGFTEQLPKNLLANVANFALNIIIGILLVPYFIGTLGVAAYGLIPLATSLTSYVTILTDSLNTAVSRFLTVDLHRGDYEKVNRTFNTAIFGLSGVVILLIPVIIALSYLAPLIFNVPPGQGSSVILLFLGVLSAFLIRSWSSNFTVTLFAHNRLDLQNLLNAVSSIVQVSLIVLLFTLFSPQLSYIGVSYLVSSIVFLTGAIILSKRINPHLRISIHDFDRSRLHDLLSMGWWSVINQVGSLFFLQIDLIAVNILFGATATGEYAVVLVWATLLRGIAGTLSSVLTPMILTYYAKDKLSEIIQISKSAVKGLGLFIALPIGLICGFAPQLLTLWVGPQFARLAPLMLILTFPLVINLCVLPLFAINVAFNKVRIPGIMTFIMGIGNVILAFSLPLLLGLGYYGVAIAGAIVLTLKNTFFIPWYATKVMNIPAKTFTKSITAGVFATLFLAGSAFIVGKIFLISSLAGLVVAGSMLSLVYFIIVWFIGFNQDERHIFLHYIPRQMRSD
jgi:O-antigen/teichoic acid export membrane protein